MTEDIEELVDRDPDGLALLDLLIDSEDLGQSLVSGVELPSDVLKDRECPVRRVVNGHTVA